MRQATASGAAASLERFSTLGLGTILWGSLERHNKEYPYLKVGMSPPAQYDGLTLAKVCNAYLTHKNSLLTSGEISERWFADVTGACELLVECLGKREDRRNASAN